MESNKKILIVSIVFLAILTYKVARHQSQSIDYFIDHALLIAAWLFVITSLYVMLDFKKTQILDVAVQEYLNQEDVKKIHDYKNKKFENSIKIKEREENGI